jgi:hypothetical protein
MHKFRRLIAMRAGQSRHGGTGFSSPGVMPPIWRSASSRMGSPRRQMRTGSTTGPPSPSGSRALMVAARESAAISHAVMVAAGNLTDGGLSENSAHKMPGRQL